LAIAKLAEQQLVGIRSRRRIRSWPLFEGICRQHPEIGAGIRHTLRRRIRGWRALNSRDGDVLFQQEYPPGRLGLTDFTAIGDLDVRIARHSARSSALRFLFGFLGLGTRPCHSWQRSFVALAEGLPNAP
jgi:hypothetical protein